MVCSSIVLSTYTCIPDLLCVASMLKFASGQILDLKHSKGSYEAHTARLYTHICSHLEKKGHLLPGVLNSLKE